MTLTHTLRLDALATARCARRCRTPVRVGCDEAIRRTPERPASGHVRCITFAGSRVMLTVDDGRRMHHLTTGADHWRRDGAAPAVSEGDLVEFAAKAGGGLLYVRPFISTEGGSA
jgi:hypothetical protein